MGNDDDRTGYGVADDAMSGYIPLDKRLRTKPKFTRLVRQLRERFEALPIEQRDILRIVTNLDALLLGALNLLWLHADDHLGDDNRFACAPDEIDEVLGVVGLAKLLPAQWLQVVESDGEKFVELPGYIDHNGTTSYSRLEASRRSSRDRSATYRASLRRDSTATSRHAQDSVTEREYAKVPHSVESSRVELSKDNPEREAPAPLSLDGSPKGKKAKTAKPKPSRRCPPDFQPDRAYTLERLPDIDIDRELRKFKDHEFKRARSDWDATWRTWLDNCADGGRYAKVKGQRTGNGALTSAQAEQRIVEKRVREGWGDETIVGEEDIPIERVREIRKGMKS